MNTINTLEEKISTQDHQVLVGFTSCLSSALAVNNEGVLSTPQESQASSDQILHYTSASVDVNAVFCSTPSLSLKNPTPHHVSTNKDSLEMAAAANLAQLIEVPRSGMRTLPSTLVRNVVESFMSLVDSRVRSYLSALSLQASSKDPSSAVSPMLQMLATTSPGLVRPATIVNSIRVVGCSTTVNGAVKMAPLVQETIIDLDILGEVSSVVISGSGTICGNFEYGMLAPCLSKVVVYFDTTDLLRSMMAKARTAVKMATRKIVSQVNMFSAATRSTTSGLPNLMAPTNLANGANSATGTSRDGVTPLYPQSGKGFRIPQPKQNNLRPASMALQSSAPTEKQRRGPDGGKLTEQQYDYNYDLSSKGLDLLTRAAVTLKRDHEQEAFLPSKHARHKGITPQRPNDSHHGLTNIEEV